MARLVLVLAALAAPSTACSSSAGKEPEPPTNSTGETPLQPGGSLQEPPTNSTGETPLQPGGSLQDAQCSSSYTNLSDSWRVVNYTESATEDRNNCDNMWSGPGWFRFMFPGLANGDYARIPDKAPAMEYRGGGNTCGTYGTPWIWDSLPAVGEPPKDVLLRFSSGNAHDHPKVVACLDHLDKTYFLYYLYPTTGCNYAYCALV